MSQSIPEKARYKLNEVCAIADTQPYVLRFWESEFPQLAPRKSRSGHPIYTRDDVDLILRIKRLLHEQELTLSDAREALSRGGSGDGGDDGPEGSTEPEGDLEARATGSADVAALEERVETYRRRCDEIRGRYDAAVEEVRRLKEDLDSSASLVDERDTARREAEALRERLAELEKVEHQMDRTRGVQRERDHEVRQLRERVDDLAATLEATAAERDRARERAESAVAEAGRLGRELDDLRDAVRGERSRLADRLEAALMAFRELTRGEAAREDDAPVS